MGEGLATTVAGTQTYDASQNTITHSYVGKAKVKSKPATIKQKKKDFLFNRG